MLINKSLYSNNSSVKCLGPHYGGNVACKKPKRSPNQQEGAPMLTWNHTLNASEVLFLSPQMFFRKSSNRLILRSRQNPPINIDRA